MDYDLVVIGGGSGGVRAARLAAQSGARVALIEERDLGGTCVNRGCVPKKLFVYAARFGHAIHDSRAYGWSSGEAKFDWPTLVANKDAEIARLNGIYTRVLDTAGVQLVRGTGVVAGPHEVRVGERTLSTERILVAVGGAPYILKLPGWELAKTSDDLFHLEALPERIVIAGGGYIGIEFASIFAMLGVEVHVVHRGAEILRGFDDEVRSFLRSQLQVEGVHFHLGRTIDKLAKVKGAVRATLDDGSTLDADVQVAAIGRRPLTQKVGLADVGVELAEDGAVCVDENYRTNIPSIFALGDIIDRLPLTPVAIAEAIAFVSTQFAGVARSVDYEEVPTAVFTTPTLATVGLSEEQAWSRGAQVNVYSSTFRPMRDTLPDRAGRSMIKLVVDARDDKVLGAHVVHEEAAEIVQCMAVALKCGVTKTQMDSTIGIHPSVAEELVQLRQPTRTARIGE